jgi:hypothetical protein
VVQIEAKTIDNKVAKWIALNKQRRRRKRVLRRRRI